VGSYLIARVIDCFVRFGGGPVSLKFLTECVFGEYSPDYAKRVFKILNILVKRGLVRRLSHGFYKLVNFPSLADANVPIIWTATNIICSDCQYPKGTVLTFDEFLQERKSCNVKSFEEGFNIVIKYLIRLLKSLYNCDISEDIFIRAIRKVSYVQSYLLNRVHPILEKLGYNPGEILHIDFRHEGPKLICEDPELILGVSVYAWAFAETAAATLKSCNIDPEAAAELDIAIKLILDAISRIAKRVQEERKD